VLVRAWPIACRVVGVLVIAGFVIAAFTVVPNRLARRLAVPADVGPADAIVVLGVSADRDGSLSDASLRRAVAGIALHKSGLAPRLVFLGMDREAESRARLAVALGVAREAIITENEEPTTRDEAERMGEILGRRQGARTVLLVTDVLHMRRARRLFERAGLAVRPVPTHTGSLLGRSPERRLLLTRELLQEVAALGYHKLFGYL